jgi:dipeptidyl aminopeptidase/acylaminoacyl peptidase
MAKDAHAQEGYQKPPAAVLKVLNAPVTARASVGRARDIVLFYSPVLYPPIADLAQPFVRLAGLRIDTATNGPHNAPQFDNLILKRVDNGQETKLDLPPAFNVSLPLWSPGGHRIAFTHATQSGIELWLADALTGKAAAVSGVKLNAAFSSAGPSEATGP